MMGDKGFISRPMDAAEGLRHLRATLLQRESEDLDAGNDMHQRKIGAQRLAHEVLEIMQECYTFEVGTSAAWSAIKARLRAELGEKSP